MSNTTAIENAILDQKMQQVHDNFFAEIDRYEDQEEQKAEQLYFQARDAREFNILMLRQRIEESMMNSFMQQTLHVMRVLKCPPVYAMREIMYQNTLVYHNQQYYNYYM
jgi:hypothetical protein